MAQPKVVRTFQSVADSWLDLKMAEWEGRSGKQNRGRLAANVYPVIGDLPIDKITVNDIELALKHIISRTALAERRALLQQYADYLDELRDSAQSQKE